MHFTLKFSLLAILKFLFFLITLFPYHLITRLDAATARTSRGITIDGELSEWNLDELVYEDSSNDSSYGTCSQIREELEKLYVTWDNSNFYMAVTGANPCKALVVYLSTGSGGISDAAELRNTSGGTDSSTYNWWWGAKHKFPSNFTPQFQWNSFGMRIDPGDGSHGFFHYEGSPIRPVARIVSQARLQSSQPNTGAVEIAIPWTTLFEGIATPAGQPIGIPAGAQIKIAAILKDGEGKSGRESIPNQSGTFSSDGNSFFTFDSFVTIPVALSTGTPLFNVSPVPRNFQAMAGPEQVSLSWQKRGAFENYLKHFAIERSTDNFVTMTTITTTSTSYVDENLTNGTTYSYRIRAVYELSGQGLVAASGASAVITAMPSGPKVMHMPVTQFAYPNQPLQIQAVIPKPTGENLTSLRLFWRPKGAVSFSNVVTTKTKSGDTFTFEISSINVNPPGIDYYIDARSNSGITLVPANAPNDFFPITILESVSQMVKANEDTTVSLPASSGESSTSLFIPAFSLAASFPIGIESKSIADLIADKQNLSVPTNEISNTEPAAIYDFFALDSAGNKISTSFSKKATLTLRYFQSVVNDIGLDATRLRGYRWSGAGWVRLGGTVNTQNQTVTVQVDHLSRFALFETNSAFLSPAGTPELKQVIRSSFFPHLGEVLEFVVDPPAETKLEIFTAKGALVRSIKDALIWDGRNDAGETVESGVYIYQLNLSGKKISGSCVVIR